jgi:hypothetical protein
MHPTEHGTTVYLHNGLFPGLGSRVMLQQDWEQVNTSELQARYKTWFSECCRSPDLSNNTLMRNAGGLW